MANKQEKESPRCLEYARQHTVMLLLLLLFFGVLIVPRFYEQMKHFKTKKTDGIVKTIYYSQYTPIISFVEITYTIDNKEYSVKELINQHIKVGDHVEIFVGKDKTDIQYHKPSVIIPSILLATYFLILFLCVYKVYCFFMKKK